jgi:hypothetical protein
MIELGRPSRGGDLAAKGGTPPAEGIAIAAHAAPPKAPQPSPTPLVMDFGTPLPTREGDDLFPTRSRNLASMAPDPRSEARETETSPFGKQASFALPQSLLFGGEEEAVGVAAAWGSTVPASRQASPAPSTKGYPEEGGFAEGLFREKALRDVAAEGRDEFAAPKRDCAERVILDGDGRPLAPMLAGEEEEFAKAFFELERRKGESKFLKKLKRKLVRMLVVLCVLALAGGVAIIVLPREKVLALREGAVAWLEPGMAVLDFLPDSIRPEWLPRTDYGIESVDENGNPVKLNAMEGLERLKDDVGSMRGAAEAGLKALESY